MNTAESKNIFQQRLYLWARNDALREIEDGFPLLSTVRSKLSVKVIDIFNALAPAVKVELAVSLVKSGFMNEISDTPERMTKQELEYCEWYLEKVSLRSDRELDLGGKIPKKKLAKVVVERMTRSFGAEPKIFPRSLDCIFYSQLGGWCVSTTVGFGDRYKHLTYFHGIRTGDMTQGLANYISLFSWMGISSETNWILESNGQIEAAAEALVNVSNHFLKAVPVLVEGLGP